MARPRKEINKKQFESLCGLQCTEKEICAWFDVCEDTLNNWCKRTYRKSFSEVFAQKRGSGKISLRRNQFQLAEKNASMAIWLGKQYLEQREPDAKTDSKPAQARNNLLEVIMGAGEVDTNDLPEVE